jgi:hypothetical protein
MSYDDGSEHDRRLVAIFNDNGIRATFHLNSSSIGQEYRIGHDEVASLYRGHEVSCHGATHADLTHLSDDEIRGELSVDKEILEDLSGGPVRGLAYAFGAHDDRVVGLVAEAGFSYARGIHDIWDFSLPEDALRLTTTCHHGGAMDMGRRLLENDSQDLQWMRVYGHSYELDGFMTGDVSKNWEYMEAFCRMIRGHRSIWYTTLIETIDYLAAMRSLETRDQNSRVCNRSNLAVWLKVDGFDLEVPAGMTIDLPGGQSAGCD